MQASLTLKKRGHSVTIFEKDKLGGQFNLAPLPSQKDSLQKQIDYFFDEIKDNNITVINSEATAEQLIGNYDGVIIATGSKPFIPPIDGLKEYHWAEILYEFNLPKNKNVVIIGGGMIGVEIANTLVDYDNKVTIIEMLDELARGMEMITKKLNLLKLSKSNVQIFIGATVTKIDNDKIYFLLNDEQKSERMLEGVDIFVVTPGMRPNKTLIEQLEGKIPYFIVGDANTVNDATSAIQSGYFVAKEL